MACAHKRADAVRPYIHSCHLGALMQITLKLFATLRTGRFDEDIRDYPPGTRIADIMGELGIPDSEIGMIMLNHRHAEPEQELHAGDTLALFPLVGGG
jgi:sulfur-carrier protein